MEKRVDDGLKRMQAGIALSLLAFLFGFGLGGAFGAAEDAIKASLSDSAADVQETVYRQDADKIALTISKSWSYFKRAHLHAGGMGAASLSMILLLCLLPKRERIKTAASTLLGLGAVGYPLFWLLAGRLAPSLGSTDAAKEALTWLAVPSAGCFLVGTFLVFGTFVLHSWGPKE